MQDDIVLASNFKKATLLLRKLKEVMSMGKIISFDSISQAGATKRLCLKYDKTAPKWVDYIHDAYDWVEWQISEFYQGQRVKRQIIDHLNSDPSAFFPIRPGLFVSRDGTELINRVYDTETTRANYFRIVSAKEMRENSPELYVKYIKVGVEDYISTCYPLLYKYLF